MRHPTLLNWLNQQGARFDEDGPVPTVRDFGDPEGEVAAGRRGGLLDLSPWALVEVGGADRVDYLNRMCTQDVRTAEEERAVPAVFTTAKGRVLDQALIHAAGETLRVAGSAHQGPALHQWLDKYVIMEDCSVEDLAQRVTRLLVFGATAAAAVGAVFGTAPTDLHSVVRAEFEGAPLHLLAVAAPGGLGVELHVPLERAAALHHQLVEAALTPVGSAAYEILRIERGLPVCGREYGEHTNPLEAGLRDSVSFTKGCYIGQEVVARLQNYRKVRRCLGGLRFPMNVDPQHLGELFDDELRVGRVTSAARSARCDATLALALLNTRHSRPGTEVRAEAGGQTVQGVVSDLPFC